MTPDEHREEAKERALALLERIVSEFEYYEDAGDELTGIYEKAKEILGIQEP